MPHRLRQLPHDFENALGCIVALEIFEGFEQRLAFYVVHYNGDVFLGLEVLVQGDYVGVVHFCEDHDLAVGLVLVQVAVVLVFSAFAGWGWSDS
mgnify:CR=1 FL=1